MTACRGGEEGGSNSRSTNRLDASIEALEWPCSYSELSCRYIETVGCEGRNAQSGERVIGLAAAGIHKQERNIIAEFVSLHENFYRGKGRRYDMTTRTMQNPKHNAE